MKKKSTAVRVMAIICIVLLVGMYITSLVLAIIQHKSAGAALKISMLCTIVVPVWIYIFMMFHKLATRNRFMNSEEDEISEKDIPEKDGKITTASAAALMPALTCPRPLPRATISALCGTLNPTISRVTNEKCRHIPRRSPIYSRKA